MADINNAAKALKFLAKSGLVNLDTPISKIVAQAGELDIAGRASLIFWSQIVLVTAPCSGIVAIGERVEPAATGEPRKRAK